MRSYSQARLCLHMGSYEYSHTFLGSVYELCSHESLSPVTLSLFISEAARSKWTCTLDLVHLKFLETGCFISCKYLQTEEARHVKLNQDGEYTNPNTSTLVLSEIDSKTKRPPANSLWRIVVAHPSPEGAVPMYSKSCVSTAAVYFQDVVTLKYLGARPCQQDDLGWKVDLSSDTSKDCLWHLLIATPQITDVEFLAETTPCMIRHVSSDLYLGGMVDDQTA